jgi:putative oxidoreductase
MTVRVSTASNGTLPVSRTACYRRPMSFLDRLGASYAALVLRFGVGGIFLIHGISKLQTGLRGVTGFFGSLGIPLPGVGATVVMTVETLGALCVILGIVTRSWAACMAIEMVVVIVVASLPGHRGFELEALLLAGAVALIILGDGAISVGSRIKR